MEDIIVLEDILVLIIAPIIVFMVFVAPLWVIMHYVTKSKKMRQRAPEDREHMEQLWRLAEKMEQRLDSLESILETKQKGARK